MYLYNSLLIATLLITETRGFSSINISQNVIAGQNMTVGVVRDDFDSEAVNYTVGLYTTVQSIPICLLIDSLPISTTQFQLSIPASVGPSGFYYRINLAAYTEDNTPLLSSRIVSDAFFLHNATGVFSAYEMDSGPSALIGNAFYSSPLPCSAYNCARQCVRADPPDYFSSGGPGNNAHTIYDSRYLSCLERCPGVPSPLPPDRLASTTTGSGALPTVVPQVATVNASCSVDFGETPCGSLCCASGEGCLRWGDCERVVDSTGSATTSSRGSAVTGVSSTSTGQTAATTTGASVTEAASASASASVTGKSGDGGKVQVAPFFTVAIGTILGLIF